MCTLLINLYMLLTWGPHMLYLWDPYIFNIYMIKCGWLGELEENHLMVDPKMYRLGGETDSAIL